MLDDEILLGTIEGVEVDIGAGPVEAVDRCGRASGNLLRIPARALIDEARAGRSRDDQVAIGLADGVEVAAGSGVVEAVDRRSRHDFLRWTRRAEPAAERGEVRPVEAAVPTGAAREAELKATGDLTTAKAAEIETQEKAIALQERQRALEERKKTAYDTAGNVVNAQGETLTSIINTLKGYGLTEEQARQSTQGYINPKPAAYSIAGFLYSTGAIW